MLITVIEFREISQRVGPDNAVDFMEQRRVSRGKQRFSFLTFIQDPLRELPQVRLALYESSNYLLYQ